MRRNGRDLLNHLAVFIEEGEGRSAVRRYRMTNSKGPPSGGGLLGLLEMVKIRNGALGV